MRRPRVAHGGVAELDCGGLTYCSKGGTGKNANDFTKQTGLPAFPDCCDDDGDGLGTITRGSNGDFQLRTLATSENIGSGDTFIESFTDASGNPQQLTGSLNYMFNTTPAIRAYDDGSGTETIVSYPAAADAPGTARNPVPLKAVANGDYVMKIEFWRPQRDAITEAGEAGGFVDIGHLNYQIEVPNGPSTPSGPGGVGPSAGVGPCDNTAVTTDDRNLSNAQQTFFTDAADDKPSDPASTLRLKIDFTKCLAQKGQSLAPGSSLTWEIQALSTVNDVSAQGWFICVPAAGKSDCKAPQGPPPNNNPPPGS